MTRRETAAELQRLLAVVRDPGLDDRAARDVARGYLPNLIERLGKPEPEPLSSLLPRWRRRNP